jgi:peroxiredoxin (alkyl hydroperoxide reductase subunit C)
MAFSSAMDEFDALDAAVIGVSTDGVHCHQAWQEFHVGKLRFPLASDQTLRTCRDYGVLIEEEGIATRGLFIVDPHGVVRYQVVHDLDTGRSVGEPLRVLHALQTARKVPANWNPGDETLALRAA